MTHDFETNDVSVTEVPDPNFESRNPPISIWQFMTVQDMMKRGELDGDSTDAADVARHLSCDDFKPSEADMHFIAKQCMDYDRHYRS